MIRVGPRAGETIAGSLPLGRCTKAAAKAQLRDIETWEEAAKSGRHLPGTSWGEVTESLLDERALTCTEQTLARAKRVLSLCERWRRKTVATDFSTLAKLFRWGRIRIDHRADRPW